MSTADRRAALEMHRLGKTDREWVLGQLEARERERIRPLLEELDAMDIRVDFDTAQVPEPSTAAASHASAPATAEAPPAREVVRSATAASIARVLSEEPTWIAEALLAIEPWSWANEVREALGRQRARSLRRTGPDARAARVPPALSVAVIERVAARISGGPENALARTPVNGHVPNGHSGLRKLLSGVRRWLP